MGLPKNFQKQNTQIAKRVDSLNELNYYKVTYEFRFTKSFMEQQHDSYDWGTHDTEWGVPLSTDRNSKHVKVKKFSALNDETAEKKMVEWLDKQVENEIISEYEITLMEKDDLHDVLREKGLLPLLNYKKEE